MDISNEFSRLGILLRFFTHLLKGHKSTIVIQAVLSVLGSLLDLLSIALVVPIVSAISGGVDTSMFDGTFIKHFIDILSYFDDFDALRYVLAAFFVTILCKEIVMFLSQFYGARINMLFEKDLRIQALEKSYDIPFASFTSFEQQDMFTTIVQRTANAARACGTFVEFPPLLVLIAVNGAVLVSVSSIEQLLAGAAVVLVMLGLNSLLLKRFMVLSSLSIKNIAVINGQVMKFVSANKYIRQNNFVAFAKRNFSSASDRFTSLGIKRAFLKQASPALQKIMGNVIIFLILFHATYTLPYAEGEFLAYVSIYLLTLSRVAAPTLRLNELRSILAAEYPATLQMWRFLQLEEERITTSKPHQMVKANQGLVIKNLSFGFAPSSTEVLKNINLTVEPGSFVAIVGKSGSGKSTLLDIIAGIYKPTSGDISLNGVNIGSVLPKEWRKGMAIVSQKPVIFFDSIKNNICLGNPDTIPDDLTELLQDVSLDKFVAQLDEGIDTILGQDGDTISGGQVQRIAIARALYKKPAILILDEATSAQDPNTEKLLKDTLARLRGKVTLLIVAHRLNTIKEADTICVLEEGQIIAQGTHDELLERAKIYQDFVENQSI